MWHALKDLPADEETGPLVVGSNPAHACKRDEACKHDEGSGEELQGCGTWARVKRALLSADFWVCLVVIGIIVGIATFHHLISLWPLQFNGWDDDDD